MAVSAPARALIACILGVPRRDDDDDARRELLRRVICLGGVRLEDTGRVARWLEQQFPPIPHDGGDSIALHAGDMEVFCLVIPLRTYEDIIREACPDAPLRGYLGVGLPMLTPLDFRSITLGQTTHARVLSWADCRCKACVAVPLLLPHACAVLGDGNSHVDACVRDVWDDIAERARLLGIGSAVDGAAGRVAGTSSAPPWQAAGREQVPCNQI